MTSAQQINTVHITISVENGCVLVQSSQNRPSAGNVLDPVTQLGLEIAMLAGRSGAYVSFQSNPIFSFLSELISPEGYGHAVSQEVREHAKRLMLSTLSSRGAGHGH